MSAVSQTARQIEAIIAAGPAPILKAAGFRKAGRGFYRTTSGLWQVVHFQASQWNSPLAAQFTVNLNIVQPFFHEVWSGRPFPANPASAVPILSQRIGMLMPGGLDHWWEVTASTEVNLAGTEIAEAIADLGLPFLTDCADVEKLLQEFEDKQGARIRPRQSLYRAILLASRGDKGAAFQAIKEAAAANKVPVFAETISLIALRLGVSEAAERGAVADRGNGDGLPEA
jgi:hypothetical protein